MSGKIKALFPGKVSIPTLLAQIAETENVDGLVALVRVDGRWQSVWSSGIELGSLCMASMKLDYDVQAEMHKDDE